MSNAVILSEAHWIWPLVLFPYEIEHSHTRTFTGRTVIGGMKSALARVRLELRYDGLEVRGRLSGTVHLKVDRDALLSCDFVGGSRPLVEVRFSESDRSRLARLLLSGAPAGARDRVTLNVESPSNWKAEIDRLIART
ncbi:MAG: hypothetical protein OEQ47_00650 [Acidimicrobiia bacterium]|nr:hypothetical protein [Acidimicrobiia bacterium]